MANIPYHIAVAGVAHGFVPSLYLKNVYLSFICHLSYILGIRQIFHSNIYPTRCNFTQFIFIWKLLYMFRVVPPPTIRSAYNCIYSIWYLSHRYCYLRLLRKRWIWFECAVVGVRHSQHTQTSFNSSTIAADSSNGVTNTRCCRYSCMRSWWWVEEPPETCRAVSR